MKYRIQACPPVPQGSSCELPLHRYCGVPFPGNVQPSSSTHVMVSDASLDQTHGMLAGNLELLGIDGLMHNPRIVQEVWLWVETRL